MTCVVHKSTRVHSMWFFRLNQVQEIEQHMKKVQISYDAIELDFFQLISLSDRHIQGQYRYLE